MNAGDRKTEAVSGTGSSAPGRGNEDGSPQAVAVGGQNGGASAPGSPLEPESGAPAGSGASDGGTGTPTSAARSGDEISAIVRETVTQTLSTLGVTPETAFPARLFELERLMTSLARSPDEMKSKLENVFGALVERLEDARGLFSYNRQKRLFMDLLGLHDLILDLEGSVGNAGSDPHRTNYHNLREQLLQLLAVNGVTQVISHAGTPFSPQQHRVVRIVRTENSSEDGHIDSVVREGFAFGAFTVRPTDVVVKKHTSGAQAAPTPA